MSDASLMRDLYRMPWTAFDNPNGWVEVTTHCQLKCANCYRGLDKPNPFREHASIQSVKSEVDCMIHNRNIECISIAGGEPLLYPDLPELIAHIYSRGRTPQVLTNGLALSETMCEKINSIQGGKTIFLAHVGKYQNRGDEFEEKSTLIKRIKKYGNLRLSLTTIVSPANLQMMPKYLAFNTENVDSLAMQLFTLNKNLADDTCSSSDVGLSSSDVVDQIRTTMPFEPCAYLPTTRAPDSIGWLFTYPVYFGGKVIGFLDGEIIRALVETYYKRFGHYAYVQKSNELDTGKLVALVGNRRARAIHSKYLDERGNSPDGRLNPVFQLVLFVKPAEKLRDNIWNICEGCPDAMYFKGKLVPSCLLERIKEGENIMVA